MIVKKPLAKPVARPVSPNPKLAVVAKPAEERATKSVTTRMPPASLDMLDSVVASYESDRTEVIKRAIRLLNACLSGHNAVVIITDRSGKAKEINLVIDGVPT